MHFSQAYFYVRAPYTNLCSCDNNNKECPVPDTSYENVQLIGGGDPIPKVETSNEVFYYCNRKYQLLMFSLLAFLGTALDVDKDAWNVPPHQLLTFTVGSLFLSFVKSLSDSKDFHPSPQYKLLIFGWMVDKSV